VKGWSGGQRRDGLTVSLRVLAASAIWSFYCLFSILVTVYTITVGKSKLGTVRAAGGVYFTAAVLPAIVTA
jgi:hypothetical protein